jgi:hypothetical protein
MSRVPSTSCGFTSLKLLQLLVAGMVVSACSQRYLVGVGGVGQHLDASSMLLAPRGAMAPLRCTNQPDPMPVRR